jgi:hypothetical protein
MSKFKKFRSLPILVEWRTQNKSKRNIRKGNHKDLEIVITQLHLQILHLTLSSTRESRELWIASNKELGLEGENKDSQVVSNKESGLEGENKDSQVVSNKESGLEGGSKELWVLTTKNQCQRERKKSCE